MKNHLIFCCSPHCRDEDLYEDLLMNYYVKLWDKYDQETYLLFNPRYIPVSKQSWFKRLMYYILIYFRGAKNS